MLFLLLQIGFVVLGSTVLSSHGHEVPQWHLMPDSRLYHEECISHFNEPITVSYQRDSGITTVTFRNGTVVQHAPCPFSRRRFQNMNTSSSYYSSWVVDVQSIYSNTSSPRVSSDNGFGNMYSEWIVPSPPTSQGPAPPILTSAVYIFNGLEDGGGHGNATVILQPVLQYGRSGCVFSLGNWYLTSFHVTASGRAYCGATLGPLQPGEKVSGNMTLIDPATNTWSVQSVRFRTNEVSQQVSVGMPTLDAAYLTLEGMVIYTCSAFPANGNVTFTNNILLDRTLKKTIENPNWQIRRLKTECNQNAVVPTNPTDPITLTWDPKA